MNPSPFPHGTSVCAYLRDSGHEDQETSIDQQEKAIRDWCLANGLVLSRVYADAARPGSTTVGRDAFQEMMANLRAGSTDAGVVIWKYNRFARDIDDAQFFKADLRRRGYKIFSINDSVPDGLDGRFFEAAIDWMNARYLEDMKVDIKRGQHHMMDEHGVIGGKPPYGFMRLQFEAGQRRDGRPRMVGKWVVDPDKVETVKRAWTMRAAGASYRAIHDELNIFNSLNAYPTFFRNRLYIGDLVFSGKVYEEYVTPIIDIDTWNTVQILNKKSKSEQIFQGDHPRRYSSTFILSGLVRCARCNSPLNGTVVAFKETPEYRYTYYYCPSIYRGMCDAQKIRQEILEQTVIDVLKGYLFEPDRRIELVEAIRKKQHNYAAEVVSERSILVARLKEVNTKRKNLTDIIASKGTTVLSLVDKLSELDSEAAVLERKLKLMTGQEPQQNFMTPEDILSALDTAMETIDQADRETQRSIIHSMCESVVVERTGDILRGTVVFYKDFMPIERCPRRDSNSQP
ncbi:MAG TPA: recombinase family protein [Anaerolineaceae bacterium]|nr:recombinase family protein [Anaerolineaceae bacterium]HPN54221.1 recombinase family protein [Anaerolineaceae bacterium]